MTPVSFTSLQTDLTILAVVLSLVVLVPLLLMLLVRFFQRDEVLKDIKSLVFMSVKIPKDTSKDGNGTSDFKELIAPMEQFYSSLTTIIHERNFLDWLFSTPAHISFEFSSVDGVIVFAIVCPKRIQPIIERQLHSYFPQAEITLGNPVKLFGGDHPVVAGVVLEQSKSFILPIKTYKGLEADPLQALTNAMTKLHEGTASMQVLIRPINENWRMHTSMGVTQINNGQMHLVNRGKFGRTVGVIGEALKPQATQQKSLSPDEETMVKALQEKGSKVGFETIIRLIATGKDESIANSNLDTLISSFSQYYSPQLNSLKYRKVLPGKIARDYLLRIFKNAPKLILNVEEISSLYHLPNKSLETPGIKWLKSRSLSAPTNLPEAGVVIGESSFRGINKLVRMQEEDRRRHLFMIGKTGTGKTTLFETMIEQDMVNGKGLCFIDPLGDAIENLLKKVPTNRAKDVILFDPSDTSFPMGLNLLEYHNVEERDFLIQEVIEVFYKLFDPNRTGIVGPQWEHWARNAALTVMNNPEGGSIIDLPRLFMDDAFREESIKNLTDPIVRSFWEDQMAKTSDYHKSEMYNYFISKFGRFMTNDLMRNIIGQKKSSFNFREIMDDGKILFINLAKGKIGDINSNLLGLILVSKIQVAAFSRADIPEEERKDFYLYVDEFQNFTTDTFATILSEARKYRLCLNVANQYFAQLTEKIRDAVIGNVGTIVSYRIGAEDADFLTHEMANLKPDDLTNLDRFQAYVKLLIDLTPTKPFSMKGVKLDNKGSVEMSDWIRNWTRQQYSMPPVEIISAKKIKAESEKVVGVNNK